jgi:hypothetical protein
MEATRRPKAGHGSPAFAVTMAASVTMRLERPTMRSMPTCFTFAQAQERARTFFGQKARELAGHSEPQAGPPILEAAIGDYLAARERRGSKGARADRYAAAARIIPDLGKIELSRLTTKRIRDWHEGVASSASMSGPAALRPRRRCAALMLAIQKPSGRADRRQTVYSLF